MFKKIISILILLIPIFSFSQNPIIKDVDVDVKNDEKVIVNFKIIDNQKTTHFVDFILMDRSKNVYIPESVVGSIGPNIKNGENSISFKMLDQDFPLDQELTPSIILNNDIKNGPQASLLSLIIPGLGDYFVENPKNMVIKPYYRTLAVGGFLALAFIADSKRDGLIYYEKEELISNGEWVRDNGSWEYIESWITKKVLYEKPNPNNYWLFNNDKEVFIGVAAGIWALDVFWVLSKGQQNSRIRKALKNKNYKIELSGTGISYKLNLD